MSPLAGWKSVCLVEAGEPVFGVLFTDHEERSTLLADGEKALYLAWDGRIGFQG